MIPLKPRSSIQRAQSGLFGPFVERCRVGTPTYDRFGVEDVDKGVFLAQVRVTRKKDK